MQYLFDFIASVLAFFYQLVPNYAFAIIALTLLVMIVTTPLTLKSTRSMMMMQQLQPEMKKIQSQYKDDREKLNEELLKFYKENNINPLGGCLPLLVQMPVFLVLYQVLRGLTRRVSDLGFAVGWAGGQASTGSANSDVPTSQYDLTLPFDPAFLNSSTALYQSLSSTTTMQAFGIDLAESASQALQNSVVESIPYFVLIAVVAVTGYVQQRQIQGRNPNAEQNPQQQMLMKVMPIFLPVISFGLPGGLVLYFAVSNLYRVGQQWFISRSIYGISGKDGAPKGGAGGSGGRGDKKPVGKGGGPAAKDGGAKAEVTSGNGARRGKDKAPADDKAPAKRADKAPAKEKAGVSGRSGATGSKRTTGGGRVTKPAAKPATTPAKGDAGKDATDAAPPTLQPRARKQKKR
ncbi:MAG: membrane protein insertase YidC [Acidimicrobiales bacterium]